MKKLSIKMKIMLWFSLALLVLVIGTSLINFSVSRQVLNQSIQERLVNIVESNAEEIEYYNQAGYTGESTDFFLSYNGGTLEIDDDFCDYYEGICTGLMDSENNLIYGEIPVQVGEQAYSFTSVGTFKANGENYYVYEKALTGDNLDGLWLRGIVSENESTHLLYIMVRTATWLMPVLSVLALLGGYIVMRSSLRPVKKIDQATRDIADSGDLSMRVDLGQGKDEIHSLANTFNEMIARLEASFEAERQFTSDASHELRTPLTVIKSHAEYAQQFAKTPEEYQEALEVIARQSDRATALLSQLLFFARLDQGKEELAFEEVNLSQLLKDLASDRQIILRDGDVLNTDIADGIFAVADEGLMTRLVNNLLDNAFKYSGEAGHVDLGLCKKDGGIELSVTDQGFGISPENLDKIWNRFYQEDPARSAGGEESFGLGLAMVKEIARLHGGTVAVTSEVGKGSQFRVTLPL